MESHFFSSLPGLARRSLMRLDLLGARNWFGAKRVAPPQTLPAPIESALPDRTLSPQAATPRTPQTLGRYRLERTIGRGSMGAVYLAVDPSTGRQFAIKTLELAREFEGDALNEARERFLREAQTAGRLSHPDIVKVHGAGESRGVAYIVMEFVPGRDLLPHVARSQLLPIPAVVAITARVADALASAHRRGVVHRDVKPANVMVDAATNTVKVTDFGIASLSDARCTRTGILLGTPSFMSPEQLTGLPIDGRTDVYSLGVMLFQLLAGALPHQSDSMARLMAQIVGEPAPDVRRLRPEVPAALADVVAKALQKNPEARHADGGRMAAELRAVAATLDGRALQTMLDAGDDTAPRSPPARQDSCFFEATMELSAPVPRHNSDA